MRKRFYTMSFVILISFVFASCSYNIDYDFSEYLSEIPSDIKIKQTNKEITVTPSNVSAAFVFYPGAYVEYEAYLPLMVKCAEYGIKCFLVNMPCDLAFFDMNCAGKYVKNNKRIKKWYVGGHSLGGAMAASYVGSNSEKFQGLILLAAFSTKDLSDTNLDVLTIYGSKDGVLGMEKYKKCLKNLPLDYEEHIIEGGNHAQFGSYGEQKGDNPAVISAAVQQQITADYIGNFCR